MQPKLKARMFAACLAIGASAAISWAAGPSSAEVAEFRQLVPAVQKADLVAMAGQPQTYQIIVTGTVPGPGWGDGDLISTRTNPANGIWEFRFIVRRGATTGTPETLIAGFRVPGSPGAVPRGVRIQTARGVYTQMFDQAMTQPPPDAAMPGNPPMADTRPLPGNPPMQDTRPMPGSPPMVEPPRATDACLQPSQDWIGQQLVRVGDDQTRRGIRELELCRPYIVISPERPFTDRMYNPARLRLQIDERGVIRSIAMG